MWFHILSMLCEVMTCARQLKQTSGSWEQAAVVFRVGNASSVRDSKHTLQPFSMSSPISISESRGFAFRSFAKEAF